MRVLGGLTVAVDGVEVDVRGGLRRRLLLALLAAEERSVSVDALSEALWGNDALADGGANAVQAHVSRLRKLLDPSGQRGPQWLASRADGYLLHPDWLDLAAFEAAVTSAAATAVAERPIWLDEADVPRCNDCATCYQELPQLFEKATIVLDGQPKTVGRMRPEALDGLELTAELTARITRVKATCDAEIIQ